MKKIIFIFSIFIFSTAAFAKIQLVPQEDAKPQQFVQTEFAFTPNRGLEHNQFFLAAEYGFNFAPFFAFAGIQSDTNLFDAVLRSEWSPFVFYSDKGEWRFGTVFAYHFQKDSDYFREHDFILEASVRFKGKKNFYFTAKSGFSWRLSYFPAIPDFHILDGDMTLVNEFDKIWNCGIELFAAIGSYSNFRYPLFFCPQITFGLAYNFNETLRISAQVDFGTNDFLASVVYVNYALFKLGMRFSF